MPRVPSLLLLALVSLSLAASGCRRNDGRCRTDAECRAGLVCRSTECVMPECETSDDCASGACVERFCMACGSDEQCAEDEVCSEGDCVERECSVTADCEAGLACRDGLCLPCSHDSQCGGAANACHHGECVERECLDACTDGLVCDEGLCLPCSDTRHCPMLLGCVDAICAPCTEDAHCGGDRVCLEGECRTPCGPGAPCGEPGVIGCRFRDQPIRCGEAFCAAPRQTGYPESAVCDPCAAREGGCPSGRCDAALRCECTSNDECPPNLACRGGVCTGCSTDADCGCDRFCAARECHDRCTRDADCEGGDRCLVDTGRCVPCLSDADCGGGTCYEDGCQGQCGDGLFSCAPFVPCGENRRCGFCAECDLGPRTDPIGACP